MTAIQIHQNWSRNYLIVSAVVRITAIGDDDDRPHSRPINLNGEVRKEEGNRTEPYLERQELSPNSPSNSDPAIPSHLSEQQVDSKPEDRNLSILATERFSPRDQKCFEVENQFTVEAAIELRSKPKVRITQGQFDYMAAEDYFVTESLMETLLEHKKLC
jgi:hypothetical protein